jgi:hypothetical protein
MKKLITLMILSLQMFAYEFSPEEVATMNSIFTVTNIEKSLPNLKEAFMESTGENEKAYKHYLHSSIQDEYWKRANYLMTYKTRTNVYNIKNQKHVLTLPLYQEALELFATSAKNGNILSAYEGFKVLEDYFLMYAGEKNENVKKYLPIFTEPLMAKNYCIGYLYHLRGLQKDFGVHTEIEVLNSYIEKAKGCQTAGVKDYYLKGLLHENAKIKTIDKIRKAKENGELKQMGIR